MTQQQPGCISIPFSSFATNPKQQDILQLLRTLNIDLLERLCIIPTTKKGQECLIIVRRVCAVCFCTEKIKRCARYALVTAFVFIRNRCKVAYLCNNHTEGNHDCCKDLKLWNEGTGPVSV